MQTIRDVMSDNVLTVQSTMTVRDAARIMEENDVGFLPVTHEGVAAGVVTDRDIVVRVVAANRDPDQLLVGAILSSADVREDSLEHVSAGVVMLPEDTAVDEAIRVMDDRQLRRIIVHDSDFRMIGVVSRSDLAASDAIV